MNRLDSDAHPIGFPNKLVSAGVVGNAGTPVTGALEDLNPRNQPWLILGTASDTSTVQDHGKIKLAYDFGENLRLSYTLGVRENDAQRLSSTYLRDAAGNPVWSGSVNYGGRSYSVTAADFAPTSGDLRHVMQGLSLKGAASAAWSYEVAASKYDYDRDFVRSPTAAMPSALAGGAGRLTDQHGTGWGSLALRATWRPGESDAAPSSHVVDLGLQSDDYALRTRGLRRACALRQRAVQRFDRHRQPRRRGILGIPPVHAADGLR